jgi:hypothetical protein
MPTSPAACDPDDDELFIEKWPKVCSCGCKITEEQWENLTYVGWQQSGMDHIPDLELRTCGHCQSTLAIAVSDDYMQHS